MKQIVDVTPLPKPVNPFKFVALQMRATLKETTPEILKQNQVNVKELTEQIEWLEFLAGRIDYKTDRPMLCFLLAGVANNGKERATVARICAQIEQVVKEQGELGETEPRSSYVLPED